MFPIVLKSAQLQTFLIVRFVRNSGNTIIVAGRLNMQEILESEFNNIRNSMSHVQRMNQIRDKSGFVTKTTYDNCIMHRFDATNKGNKMDTYFKVGQ